MAVRLHRRVPRSHLPAPASGSSAIPVVRSIFYKPTVKRLDDPVDVVAANRPSCDTGDLGES
jgi:hypothetical protein